MIINKEVNNNDLVIAATNYARKILNIAEELWVFVNDGDMFKSNNHSGIFDKDAFAIRYNSEFLKDASTEKVMKLAFHETFHAAQFEAIVASYLGLKSELFTEDKIERLKHEFKDENYSDEIDIYETLLSEQQDESFAQMMYEKLKKEEINLDKFINEYKSLYLNKD